MIGLAKTSQNVTVGAEVEGLVGWGGGSGVESLSAVSVSTSTISSGLAKTKCFLSTG